MEPQTPTQPTQKQQIAEALRSGNSFIVTTAKNPSVDQVAATLALVQLLKKVGKSVQGVVVGHLPKEAGFLPTQVLSGEAYPQRDFVIDLDTSKTEADRLKYNLEGKKLRIYITPFNGNFSKDDVSFTYGDYHVDAVIGLGLASQRDLEEVFAANKDLVTKTKVFGINNSAAAGISQVSWNEDASSLCEMIMSMSEALQGGLLDKDIATSLLAGIVAATRQFSAPNTTPKVMTMAAQLMAAGAQQTEVMQKVAQAGQQNHQPRPADSQNQSKPAPQNHQPRREERKPLQSKGDAPHSQPRDKVSSQPPAAKPAHEPKSEEPAKPQPKQAETPSKPEPAAPVAGQPAPDKSHLSPFMSHQLGTDMPAPVSAATAPAGNPSVDNKPAPSSFPPPPPVASAPPVSSPFGADRPAPVAPAPLSQSPFANPAPVTSEPSPPAPMSSPFQPPAPSVSPPQPVQPSAQDSLNAAQAQADLEAARRAVEQAAQIGDPGQQIQTHYVQNLGTQPAAPAEGAAQPLPAVTPQPDPFQPPTPPTPPTPQPPFSL